MNIMLFCLGGLAAMVLCLNFFRLVRSLLADCEKVLRRDKVDEFLVNEFSRCNVLVYGKKGNGKDLLFSHVIELRGEKHYANMPYNQNTEVRELKDLNVGDNTFEDFINGTVKKFSPQFEEGFDFYVTDGGIYFPCQYDKELDKKYPGLAIFAALCRQLFNMNLHANCQALDRMYKKFREQFDLFLKCIRTTLRGDCLYTEIEAFDTYSKAEADTSPFMRGVVRIPLCDIQYDTRYFREFLLDAPEALRTGILKHIGEIQHVGGINHVA